MKKIIVSLLLLPSLWGSAVLAAADSPTVPAATEQADRKARKEKQNEALLHRIEQHLNRIHSMKSAFIQRAPDGTVSEGIVYLERPGKLRFDFGAKAPFLLVSNGKLLTFVDYEVKQVSRWPIRKTPLGILVDEEIKFDKSVEIPDIIRFGGLIKLPVIDPKRREYGYIVLTFEESTLDLRAWESVDAQGYVTRVTLVNPEYNVKIDPKRFTYRDPRPRRHGPRRR